MDYRPHYRSSERYPARSEPCPARSFLIQLHCKRGRAAASCSPISSSPAIVTVTCLQPSRRLGSITRDGRTRRRRSAGVGASGDGVAPECRQLGRLSAVENAALTACETRKRNVLARAENGAHHNLRDQRRAGLQTEKTMERFDLICAVGRDRLEVQYDYVTQLADLPVVRQLSPDR